MSFLLNSFRSFSINLLLFLSKSQGSHNRGWSAKAILAQRGNGENYLGSRILLSRHQNSLWPLLRAPPAWRSPSALQVKEPDPAQGQCPATILAAPHVKEEKRTLSHWITPNARGSLSVPLGRCLVQTSSILVLVPNVVALGRYNARKNRTLFQPNASPFPPLLWETWIFHGSSNGIPTHMIFHAISVYVSNSYVATCSREAIALLFSPAKAASSIPAQ